MTWWKQTSEDVRQLAPVGLSFGLLWMSGLGMSTLGLHLPGTSPMESGLLLGLLVGPVAGPTVARWKTSEASSLQPQAQTLYLDGKMRRYSLLFSVNGGAFAVAKLLDRPAPPGGLGITTLAVGAALFTVVMTADIWLFGAGMRNEHGARLFRPVGQSILLMIGALLCSGWILVSS